LNIDVPKTELLERAKKRAENLTRKDDNDPLVHLKRIEIFEDSTTPAVEYMKTKCMF
jgi:adenylate kinase